MAITLISSPAFDASSNATPVRPVGMKKLVYKASSDNYTNTGFKYVVDVTSTVGDPAMNQRFFINPDPNGNLVIDIKPIIRKLQYSLDPRTVHFITSEQDEPHMGLFRVYVKEGYNVGGVFTIDDATEINFDDVFYFDGAYDGAIGPYPSISPFVLDGDTKRLLSDIKPTTFRKDYSDIGSYVMGDNVIVIPVRDNDWGVMYALTSIITDATSVEYELVTESGSFSEAITLGGNRQCALPLYPANLNAGSFVAAKPAFHPNWKYYTIWINDSTDTQISATYIFVREQAECCDSVRLAWKGHRGGWDYFNFTKKNETEVSTERKRFNSQFADTDFTAMSRELTELESDTIRTITVNSDNLTQGQFEYLQWLILSKDVRIIRDNGTSVPVVVETNTHTNFTDCSGNKMQNVTLKLRYASDYEGESEVDESEVITTTPMVLVLNGESSGLNVGFTISSDGFTVNWGDGNTDTYSAGTSVAASHTYASLGTYTITINGNKVTSFYAEDYAFTSISSLPNTLESLAFNNSQVSELPVNEFTNALKTVVCQNSAMTTTSVNNALVKIDELGATAGSVVFIGNSAPPSGAGITAAANLVTKGWTVTTD